MPVSRIPADMKLGDTTCETIKSHAPRYQDLAECYDITAPALLKMQRKHGLTMEELMNPYTVHNTLVRLGDRRGVLVRRLSDPKIADSICDRIFEIELYPL